MLAMGRGQPLRIVGKTDPGRVRKTNQDDYACGDLPGGAVWAVVCDGMGGANGGSVASSVAVKIIAARIGADYDGHTDIASVKQLLFSAINQANAEVFRQSQSDPSLSGMGTTVIACIAAGGSAYVAHAGDSRAYLVSGGRAVQLTRDHSIVQEMLDSGKLTPEEARNHPQKNIITRALGVEETLEIDFCETTFPQDATLLICTDGLTNLVDEATCARVLQQPADSDPAGRLVEMANENGGTDNITVVLIGR